MKKENQVWITEFEGHKIKVTNAGKAKLYIDGVEAAKEKGLIHLEYELRAPIPGTDLIVIAKLDGTKDVITTCDVLVAKALTTTFGKEDEDGLFTPYSTEDVDKMKEDAEAAIVISTINTIL